MSRGIQIYPADTFIVVSATYAVPITQSVKWHRDENMHCVRFSEISAVRRNDLMRCYLNHALLSPQTSFPSEMQYIHHLQDSYDLPRSETFKDAAQSLARLFIDIAETYKEQVKTGADTIESENRLQSIVLAFCSGKETEQFFSNVIDRKPARLLNIADSDILATEFQRLFRYKLIESVLYSVMEHRVSLDEATKAIKDNLKHIPPARLAIAQENDMPIIIGNSLNFFPFTGDFHSDTSGYDSIWNALVSIKIDDAKDFSVLNEEMLHYSQSHCSNYLAHGQSHFHLAAVSSVVVKAFHSKQRDFLDSLAPNKASLKDYWEKSENGDRGIVFLTEAFANIDNAIHAGYPLEEIQRNVPDLYKYYRSFVEEENQILDGEGQLCALRPGRGLSVRLLT